MPDVKDVARLDRALTEVLGAGHHVTLTAEAGPAARYRDFLAVSRGARRIVVGTRAAAFAPVHDLGLVAIWDDGDDLHAEPRAPYPHTRETLLLRSELEGAAALVGGFARSVEGDYLLRTGWAREIAAAHAPRCASGSPWPSAGATDHELERDPHAQASRAAERGAPADPRRTDPRTRARADAAGRLRPGPGLRALPYAGAVRSLLRTARAHRADHATGLPLVWHRRRRLDVPRVRRPRAPGSGAG